MSRPVAASQCLQGRVWQSLSDRNRFVSDGGRVHAENSGFRCSQIAAALPLIDFEDTYRTAIAEVNLFRREYPRISLIFHLSHEAPTMVAVWILLAKIKALRLPCSSIFSMLYF